MLGKTVLPWVSIAFFSNFVVIIVVAAAAAAAKEKRVNPKGLKSQFFSMEQNRSRGPPAR